MQEIHDSTGKVVAWLDGDFIFDVRSGRWAAYRSGELIYAGGGKVLGFLVDDFFRDLRGNAIAFVPGAVGILPDRVFGVLEPIVPSKPARPVAPQAPPRVPPKLGWSWSWPEFLEGIPASPRWCGPK